jgi:hypothetical protein
MGQVKGRRAVFGKSEKLLEPTGGAGRRSASRVVGELLNDQTRERRVQDA